MALDRPVEGALPAKIGVRPRLPLAPVVPMVDALALAGAAVLVGHFDLLGLAYCLLTFLVLNAINDPSSRINPRLSEDVGWLLGQVAIPLLFVLPFAPMDRDIERFLMIGPVAVALLLVGRAVSYGLIRAARAQGLVFEPTVIVGAGVIGVQVATVLQQHPEYGLAPIGFLDSIEGADLPLPLLGDGRSLETVAREFGVRRVIVAFGATREPELVQIIRACDALPVEMHFIPRFFELGMAPEGALTDDLWGIPLRRLGRTALRTAAWRIKRVFDVVVGSLALAITAPLFLFGAIAVRMSSPGPIFFRQKRVGRRGEVFELLKFRTMHENDDSDTAWSVAEDDRVTRIGRFLRKSGIDELPQLINVLKGEMSLVGPRPERPHFADQFAATVPRYEDRHRVPVGITGWAQVHGLRGDTSIPDRVRFDNYYIEHWSLWRDIVILARTVKQIVTAGGR